MSHIQLCRPSYLLGRHERHNGKNTAVVR